MAEGGPDGHQRASSLAGRRLSRLRAVGVVGATGKWRWAQPPAIDGLPDTLILSLGTDGTDGPTDAAGALADGTTLQRAAAVGLEPHKSLAENDAYPFFDALGDLLVTGPTRTNVNDLMCVFVGMPGAPSGPGAHSR